VSFLCAVIERLFARGGVKPAREIVDDRVAACNLAFSTALSALQAECWTLQDAIQEKPRE